MIDSAARGGWRELEAKLRPFVARRVRSEADVDDILQDTFVRMLRGLGQLREEERFGPWVYQVTRSALIDHQRRAARDRGLSRSELEEPALESDGDGLAPLAELAGCVAPFVARLPAPYRDALTLVELEGRTQKEAARLLGSTLSGMKARVQRGRVKLRHTLEACCRVEVDVRGGVQSYAPLASDRRSEPQGDCCSSRGGGRGAPSNSRSALACG